MGLLLTLLVAGCGRGPLAPPRAALLARGWGPVAHEVFDPLAPQGTTTASLADVAAYWRVDVGLWRLTPAPWRPAGDVAGRPPGSGWSWTAAALAAQASGFVWPRAATLYRAAVTLAGTPQWQVTPQAITLWAAVRDGTVAAAWMTFRAGHQVFVTVCDQGPTVFTLPYWTAPARGLTPAQRAALPPGTIPIATQRLGGLIPGSVAVTLAEGLEALEGLLLPRTTPGGWRFLPLGPAGSALAAAPQLRWEDVTGGGSTDLTVYFGSGVARGLAIYALAQPHPGAWRAVRLFAGDGDVATEVPAPGAGRIVVLGTWDASQRALLYQTVVWRHGRFRLGPGVDAPAPPGALAPPAPRTRGEAAPLLRGLALRVALRRLGALGLGVLPLVPALVPGRPGTVLWQDPRPGTTVGAWPWVGLEVAADIGRLRTGAAPPIAQLRVEDGSGVRSAAPAALAPWRTELAWVLSDHPTVMPVVRGPGQLSGGAAGWILVARLEAPWRMVVPAASGLGARSVGVDTLAFSDAPLYAGWMLLGAGGGWVAAVQLPPGRARALRELVQGLAP
jgi:hypothetical protein